MSGWSGADAALVVVDVQAGTLPNAKALPGDVLVERVVSLVGVFRSSGRPVLFTVSTGTPAGVTEHGAGRTWPVGFDELDPRLDRRDDEPLFRRAAWSAFAAPGLARRLEERGVRQVVIAGLATTFSIESTARAAYDLGFDVVVVADAVSDPDPEGHDRTVRRILPLVGRVTTTAGLIAVGRS